MIEIDVEQVEQAAAAWYLYWKAKTAANSPIKTGRDLYPSVKPGECFGLRVRGCSMSPEINNGDIVIVLKQDHCASGDIAIVCVSGNEITVKQVELQDGGIVLVPKNAAFEQVYLSNEQIQQLQVTIIGKVVEIRGVCGTVRFPGYQA